MRENMAPEDELCLLLAPGQLPPETERRAREILAQRLRWDMILEQARLQDVLPLIHRSLQTLGMPGVSDAVAAELEEGSRINRLRSALIAEELARLLSVLDEAGVPAIPLKGVTLAEALYGDAGSRVSVDIDLLIPRDQAIRARQLLLAQGYASPVTDEFFLRHLFRTGVDCLLLPEGQRLHCPLDLHWGILPYSSKERDAAQDLWSEAHPKTFFGLRACALSPEWEFLYLAAHAGSDGWQRLKGLVDIHWLSASGLIDWQRVKAKADRLELDRVVEWTLSACSMMLGTPVPAPFAARALPEGAQLFPAAPFPAGSWRATRCQLYVLKRPADKLRFFGAVLFVPSLTEHQFLRLPAWLGFLYYPLRPLRIVCKWGWLSLRAGVTRLAQPLRAPQ
jgi:putative nucleotidyltransferase-like protein